MVKRKAEVDLEEWLRLVPTTIVRVATAGKSGGCKHSPNGKWSCAKPSTNHHSQFGRKGDWCRVEPTSWCGEQSGWHLGMVLVATWAIRLWTLVTGAAGAETGGNRCRRLLWQGVGRDELQCSLDNKEASKLVKGEPPCKPAEIGYCVCTNYLIKN